MIFNGFLVLLFERVTMFLDFYCAVFNGPFVVSLVWATCIVYSVVTVVSFGRYWVDWSK